MNDDLINSGSSPDRKRLVRSDDKMIAGVAAGLAEYFGIDVVLARVLFVASFLLPGPNVLVYLVLWFVMPDAARRSGGY